MVTSTTPCRRPAGFDPAVGLGFHLGASEPTLVEAMVAARSVVSPYGIVSACRPFASAPGLPTLPVHVAKGPRRGVGEHNRGFDIIGMGVSEDPELAWLKAVAEAVERYCFAQAHDPESLLRATADEVEEWAVPVERFGLLSDRQYAGMTNVARPGRSQAIDWTWAWSPGQDDFTLVPAALVYPSVGFLPPNNFTRWVMSTGLATHISVDAAILAGAYEIIERDSLMIHWLHRRSPRRVVLGGDDGRAGDLVRAHFDLPDFEFTLLDMTPDSGIPTIACLATSDDPGRPSLVMGAATRLSSSEAACKALFETAQLLAGFHGLGWDSSADFPEADIRTLWDNAHHYAGAKGGTAARFLIAAREEVRLGDLPDLSTGSVAGDLELCRQRLEGAGLDLFVVDLTSADAARCGFRTVKVLAPGAVDIHGDVRYPHLGSSRIAAMATTLAWPAQDEASLNTAPCPMS